MSARSLIWAHISQVGPGGLTEAVRRESLPFLLPPQLYFGAKGCQILPPKAAAASCSTSLRPLLSPHLSHHPTQTRAPEASARVRRQTACRATVFPPARASAASPPAATRSSSSTAALATSPSRTSASAASSRPPPAPSTPPPCALRL
jgi:hypothetical protein